MIRGVSGALAGDVLRAVFTGAGLSTTGPFTVALSTTVPADDGSGVTRPPAGAGYADVSVARSAGAWTVSGRRAANSGAVVFGPPTGTWGTVRAYAVFGAGGVFLFGEQLGSAQTPPVGARVSLPAGTVGLSA